jgi:hypothetical protein
LLNFAFSCNCRYLINPQGLAQVVAIIHSNHGMPKKPPNFAQISRSLCGA